MKRELSPALLFFVIGLIGLGALSIAYRDFAYDWQRVPRSVPDREILAVGCGLLEMAVGLGLLIRATTRVAARILFALLLLWLLLKLPPVIAAPGIEGVWLALGEIAAWFSGGWVLFALYSGLQDVAGFGPITGDRGLRLARILFGLAVIPIGVSHLVYVDITAALVPAWLPFRVGWAYLTGVGQIACGLGVLFLVLGRTAASIETAMIFVFAVLVWGPQSWFASAPKAPGIPGGMRFALTAFFITWIIAASALLVTTNMAPGRVRHRGPVAPQPNVS